MTTVHVLTYSHRHGDTVSVYSTEDKAQKAAAMTIPSYSCTKSWRSTAI